jgi:hypothetical protein
MNPLVDIIPTRYRRYVYAGVALVAIVYGAWQASGGDWGQFIGGLVVSITTATAASNPTTDD